MISSTLFLLVASPLATLAFQTHQVIDCRSPSLSLQSTISESAAIADQPARVIPESLPTLYVYDHCPFCVRARMALGLKNIKHNVYFMANDDVETPTKLVGKKIAPILQWEDVTMAESLDIVDLMDKDERLGPTGIIAPFTDRQHELKSWQKGVQNLLRNLQRPRYVATGLLPEFQQLDGRQAFIKNHALPKYSKEDWKAMPFEEQKREYEDCLARPDVMADVQELNKQLLVLNDLIYSPQHCSEGGLSYDDIDLFARLRSITIVKGVQWPEKLRAYMDYMSERADIPLYDQMAL